MSKPWKPDESVARPLSRRKRLKSLDAFTRLDFAGRMDRARRQQRLPDGAKAGLALVAAACVGLAIGMYAAFGPRNAIATGADSAWDSPGEAAPR